MSLRRMVPFILINVVVSATVVLLILFWWDSRQSDAQTQQTPVAGQPTFGTPVAVELAAGEEDVTDDGSDAVTESTADEEDDDGSTIHIVQPGDTLGRISQQYDVPVEDIAAANDIVNVNTISVGQQLLIPIGGLSTETPPPTAEPSAEATPEPLATDAPPEGTAVVEITEVIGVGDLTSEAVRISNSGTRPLELREWQLEDEQGHVYSFVDVTLYGSSEAGTPSILVHTEAGQNGPSDLFWGLEAPVWEAGETVSLRDAEGTMQATYLIP